VGEDNNLKKTRLLNKIMNIFKFETIATQWIEKQAQ
jgi:hypothetical protein